MSCNSFWMDGRGGLDSGGCEEISTGINYTSVASSSSRGEREEKKGPGHCTVQKKDVCYTCFYPRGGWFNWAGQAPCVGNGKWASLQEPFLLHHRDRQLAPSDTPLVWSLSIKIGCDLLPCLVPVTHMWPPACRTWIPPPFLWSSPPPPIATPAFLGLHKPCFSSSFDEQWQEIVFGLNSNSDRSCANVLDPIQIKS